MKKISRRKVLKAGASAATLLAAGCSLTPKKPSSERNVASELSVNDAKKYEFIVVGSGAGGGTDFGGVGSGEITLRRHFSTH